ncbi:TetR family transcriptional regulator [Streptomyces aidingensis]|uniref:DNA-binding transcriptional regulator, AcrR family n=1 Tax=Streptomyces aidingensis TaxID=910347 RepID=A0A1I1TC62_9ACTN|nr:TetR family transcriptional regulator [Streptomyces aidingensis]SFD56207.1 DNA-binding transcriptional regulator, AcrR family [Streptomyces aidingensis]
MTAPPPAPSSGPSTPRRRGRPPRAGRTAADVPAARDRILDAARETFAAHGYDKASVRAIARRAEVDPALVHHYFGTKEQVFEAAVAKAAAPVLAGPSVLAEGDPREIGERMTRLFFSVWENPASREPLLAIIRSVVTHQTAARIFRQFITKNLVSRVAQRLPAPDIETRIELAVAQLVGVAMLRYVLRAEPLASAEAEDLIRRLSPVVQFHLAGGPPPLPPEH